MFAISFVLYKADFLFIKGKQFSCVTENLIAHMNMCINYHEFIYA